MIRFIAAIDDKYGIADDNGIPWQGKIPGDVAYFRSKTINSKVMMGSGWYKEQQKPLPERRNFVATTSSEKLRPGFQKVSDVSGFLKSIKDDIWIGGGAGLFATTLDFADELYLTRVSGDYECTKFFPDFEDKFALKSREEPVIENGITYHFEVWVRKK